MESGVLIAIGLIFALLALLGIGIAIVNLKDINRRQRLGSSDEHKIVPPPSIQSEHSSSNKNIEFGEIIDAEKSSKYPQDFYVEISSSKPQTEQCSYCRHSVAKNEGVICPKCNSHYHSHCFRENKNTCESCKWVQP